MNREQLIEKAAKVLFELDGGTFPQDCTVPEGYRRDALAVLDAILPQVTTTEEVRALPDCTVLMFPVHGGVWFVEILGGRLQALSSGRVEDPDWYLSRYGPLTVVWQPS